MNIDRISTSSDTSEFLLCITLDSPQLTHTHTHKLRWVWHCFLFSADKAKDSGGVCQGKWGLIALLKDTAVSTVWDLKQRLVGLPKRCFKVFISNHCPGTHRQCFGFFFPVVGECALEWMFLLAAVQGLGKRVFLKILLYPDNKRQDLIVPYLLVKSGRKKSSVFFAFTSEWICESPAEGLQSLIHLCS